jgi:hypothetical protein
MPWTTVLSYASAISTALSLAAFISVLYVWLQSRARERSLLETVKGEGLIKPESVVQVLGTFTTDEARIQALREITGYDQRRAEGILDKVKSNVDLHKFSVLIQGQLQKRLTRTGIFLIVLAVLSLGASKLRFLRPADEDLISDNSPGGKARAEANLGWDYEVGHNKTIDYAKAMELYRKAAADGDATANWNIARMYEFGFGVPRDFDKARYWYDKATEAGDPRGSIYKNNIGKNKPYEDTK